MSQYGVKHSKPDSSRRGEGGETSEGYLCLQCRENCHALHCVNANKGENYSDLCTIKANEEMVAEMRLLVVYIYIYIYI